MGWGDCTHKIVQNSISDRFGKGSCIPKGMEIKFKGLTFDAHLFRGVANSDDGEVGLTCDGAERGEFWGGKGDLVRAFGFRIGKGFQSSQRRVGGDGCFAAEKAESRHGEIIEQKPWAIKDRSRQGKLLNCPHGTMDPPLGDFVDCFPLLLCRSCGSFWIYRNDGFMFDSDRGD